MSATLPFAPDACTFDGRGLFTHGEFPRYQSTNPCLHLFTHGEFPRAAAATTTATGGAQPGVKNIGRRRAYKPEIVSVCKDEEALAVTLLMIDDDDDWW